jgi:hypothetical protein
MITVNEPCHHRSATNTSGAAIPFIDSSTASIEGSNNDNIRCNNNNNNNNNNMEDDYDLSVDDDDVDGGIDDEEEGVEMNCQGVNVPGNVMNGDQNQEDILFSNRLSNNIENEMAQSKQQAYEKAVIDSMSELGRSCDKQVVMKVLHSARKVEMVSLGRSQSVVAKAFGNLTGAV